MHEGDVAKKLADAVALHQAGDHAQAEAACVALLKVQPKNADIWNLRGVNFRKLKRQAEAIRCFRHGLALAPDSGALWSNLGNVLNDVRQCESAIACHRRGVARNPTATGLHNLGIALSASGREEEAIAVYDRALALAPGHADICWDRALSLLRLGDFARGWAGYESRRQRSSWSKRVLPGRCWQGERYDGQRLLIASEQGLGDAIWVARYFRRAKELGGELIVECRAELIDLVTSMGVADRVVAKSDTPPEADFHILQCSLPGILNPAGEAMMAEPYLAPAHDQVAKMASLFGPRDERLRVGLIWGGSPTYDGRAHRDASLAGFLRWLALPHVQLYSLQKGPQAEELTKLPAGAPIIDLGVHTAGLPETAGAIAHLDLVVMTDTCVAHLCGAMGKPVWLLLNRVPHFLWQLERADTPWYPSMRLFRQKSWGEWNSVLDHVAAALIGGKL